jgi:hypothetical protein
LVPTFGWIDDPPEVERVLGQLPMPSFELSAAGLSGTEERDVFFWEFEERVLGRRLPAWNQGKVGSCVAHGWGRAAQDLLLVQIAAGNAEGNPGREVCREAIYGGARCEVGRQWGSTQDGAVGAWAGKWVQDWGIILNDNYGAVDLSGGYDERRCKEWGAKGVPDALEPECRLHPVKTVSLVETPEALAEGLRNYYPCAICGVLGRTMTRQPGGWCRVEGTWNHCQEICGVCTAKGGRPAFVYRNSWGDYLGPGNNQISLESGREVKLPDGCYLSEWEDVAAELRRRDTFVLSHATGWPPQTFSWLI